MTDMHLTEPNPKLAAMAAATHPGMAHWAGTGPEGTRCTSCAAAIFNGYITAKGRHGALKPIQCRTYGNMVPGTKPKFSADTKSCRFYTPGDGPPARK